LDAEEEGFLLPPKNFIWGGRNAGLAASRATRLSGRAVPETTVCRILEIDGGGRG